MTQRHHHTMDNHLTQDMVNDTAAPPYNGESLDTGHGQ